MDDVGGKKKGKKCESVRKVWLKLATWADHVSRVDGFAGAGMEPGGGPGPVTAAHTQTPVTPPRKKKKKEAAEEHTDWPTPGNTGRRYREAPHSLNEEDPAIPTHAVRPGFR